MALLNDKIISNVRDLSLKEIILHHSEINEQTGCLEWKLSKYRDGYGQISSRLTSETLAHRASYMAFIGEIPNNKMVCHKCDNPKCVNHNHLFIGSAKDNSHDRNVKNRQAKGIAFSRSDLSEQDIIYIRNSKEKLKDLSKKYGISMTAISKIKLNKTWKHIPHIVLPRCKSDKDFPLVN